MSKVLVIGDALVSSATLEEAAKQLNIEGPIEVSKVEWHSDVKKEEFQKYILKIESLGAEGVDLPEGVLEKISDADYLLLHHAPVSKTMIEHAKHLKFIGTCRGGMEHVNIPVCTKKKIPVIHVIRNAEPVADFTVGLIYAETRNIARAHQYIMEGKWIKNFSNNAYKTTLNTQTVGLVGLGYIGKLVAKKLTALGITVIGYDPYVDKNVLISQEIDIDIVDLPTLFATSDIISLHVRLTPETTNMVNKNLIDLMKPSSYLINTARAGLLNKADVISALKEHKIAGAALDVSWEEPIHANDELLKLNNITLTPHIAGDTVDAIPRSPYLLRDVLNDYIRIGFSDMQVNKI